MAPSETGAGGTSAPRGMGLARLWLERLGAACALLGGVVLTGAALFVAFSVGRAALGRPILGANEVVELSVGVAVACFMPWCQIRNGHIAVTVFTDRAPGAVRRGLDILAGGLVTVVSGIIAWRLLIGGIESHGRGRVSMFLELPQWWGFAAVSLPTVLWVVAAAFLVLERLRGIETPPHGHDT